MPRTLKVVTIPPPPATPRNDVVDIVHGERITDPYRWLEDDRSDRVKDWTDRQNARTRAALDRLPERRFLAARLRELLSVGLLSTPRPIAGRIFHTRREGEQKQAVLYVRDGVSDPDRALVDPNALDPAGLTTLDWYYPSQDARYVAYGLSHGGDELSTLRVIEVATGRDAGERISHTQRSTVAWVEGGFYYSFHPAPGAVPAGDENYHRRVAFHRLGADPARDLVVFGEDRAKEDINTVVVSPDGRWVLFSAWIGWVRTDVYLHDREHPERGLVTVMEARTRSRTARLTADASGSAPISTHRITASSRRRASGRGWTRGKPSSLRASTSSKASTPRANASRSSAWPGPPRVLRRTTGRAASSARSPCLRWARSSSSRATPMPIWSATPSRPSPSRRSHSSPTCARARARSSYVSEPRTASIRRGSRWSKRRTARTTAQR